MKRLTCVLLGSIWLFAWVAPPRAGTGLQAGARNGPIYFEKNNDLYAVDSSGANLRRITRSHAQELDPSVSRDGTEIAFRSGRDEIFRIGVDGKNRVNLTHNGAHDLSPAWGPTGRIAFASTRSGTSAIWTMDRQGRRAHEVSRADGEYPAWSRDGKWLAFSRPSGATYDLWVMRSDGSGLKQLTDTIVIWEGLPSWSPDNRTIVFSRGDPNGGLGGRKLWTIDRTGVVGHFYFIAQWFPKLGVLQDDGWNCHQFHSSTEFFADYGSYDVSLTVPRGWIVGATGVERERRDEGGNATVHRYYQDDVHDFAWTTSPDYVERVELFEHPTLPRVTMRLLLQPEHAVQADRHFAATRATLQYYGEWFGPYPYGHITIVDPAYQSGADTFSTSFRGTPDIAWDADPNTGVAVLFAGLWFTVGGTSASSPIIASVYALAGNAGSVNAGSYPYSHTSGLFDVTSGSNGSCSPSYLCTGVAGYDGPTGLGTPNGSSGF